ncbi:MAG: hypothetical protein M1831_003804 [Alyxoria varia]|nr:MAG: hypothetical protein M1831_003804 [Alyxoria varia]
MIEPSIDGKYPVRLGDSIREERPLRKSHFYDVRCNFKPTRPASKTNTEKTGGTVSILKTVGKKDEDGVNGDAKNSIENGENDTSSSKKRKLEVDGPLQEQSLELEIKDQDADDSTYRYAGRRLSPGVTKTKDSKSPYALIYNKQARIFTLEVMEASYAFNLVETPEEKDRSKLDGQYGKIDLERSPEWDFEDAQASSATPEGERESSSLKQNGQVENDVFGEDPDKEDTGPDPDNPFDFRHYLNGLPPSDPPQASQSAKKPEGTPQSQMGDPSPLAKAAKINGTKSSKQGQTAASPLQKAPKPQQSLSRQAVSRSAQKASSPAPDSKGTASQSSPSPPYIHVRKPSQHKAPQASSKASKDRATTVKSPKKSDEDEDSGDLVIEMDDDVPPGRGRRTQDLDVPGLNTPGGGGPISLRSAAASRSASPAVGLGIHEGKRLTNFDEDLTFDDADNEDDADVDELLLGSPGFKVNQQKDRHTSHTARADEESEEEEDEDEEDDEDDDDNAFDLVKGLEKVVDENERAGVYSQTEDTRKSAGPPQPAQDEEEESEEE